jgi:hypothetical protein
LIGRLLLATHSKSIIRASITGKRGLERQNNTYAAKECTNSFETPPDRNMLLHILDMHIFGMQILGMHIFGMQILGMQILGMHIILDMQTNWIPKSICCSMGGISDLSNFD